MIRLLIFLSFLNVPSAHKDLTWGDYKGMPPTNTQWLALTQTTIGLTTTETDGIFTFAVTLEFDRDGSWTKTDDPKVLKHEAVHYDISWVMCERIRKALLPYQYTGKKKEAIAIYDKLIARWNWMEQLYDRESFHGKDVSGQKKWEVKINKELKTSYTFLDH